jgi:hypothetical protein
VLFGRTFPDYLKRLTAGIVFLGAPIRSSFDPLPRHTPHPQRQEGKAEGQG